MLLGEGSLGLGKDSWAGRRRSGLAEWRCGNTARGMERFLTSRVGRPDAQRWGWDRGWPGRRDRLPLCPRPCPDATLRCSRTNGKVFPVLPSSWAPTTTPWVYLQLAPSLPSPLFWPLPLLPQTPTSVIILSPLTFLSSLQPPPLCNSLPVP